MVTFYSATPFSLHHCPFWCSRCSRASCFLGSRLTFRLEHRWGFSLSDAAHRCTVRLGVVRYHRHRYLLGAAALSKARSVWLILARNPEDLAPF